MNRNRNNQKGFTLIETVVAILILSLTVGALLTLSANGIFSVRYARNQIVANNLAQEALEYVRAHRDTMRQLNQAGQPGNTWADFLSQLNVNTYGQPSSGYTDISGQRGCFLPEPTVGGTPQGCIISAYTDNLNTGTPPIWQMTYPGVCTGQPSNATSCPNTWFYQTTGFYGYPSRDVAAVADPTTKPIMTTYIRWVNVRLLPSDNNQLVVTATIVWNNGLTQKTLKQSMLLTNWSQ